MKKSLKSLQFVTKFMKIILLHYQECESNIWFHILFLINVIKYYYLGIRDINKWSEKMKAPMIQIYGEDYFRNTWSNWIDAMLRLYKKQNGDLCKQVLSKIKCPTLIIHGAKDVMVLPEHPTYLKQKINDSRFVSLQIKISIICTCPSYFTNFSLVFSCVAEFISSKKVHIIFI